MPQFPHEEVAFESGINVRFTIYNSNNDYSGFCCYMPEIIMW